MYSKNLLVIGHQWPEPLSSAAGVRMMQLLQLFLDEKWAIDFATVGEPSERAEDLSAFGIRTHQIELNSAVFDEKLKHLMPSVVVFDRFMTEEQYSWRVKKIWPDALLMLDTEDLHFLRNARAKAIKIGVFDWQSDIALREWAALLRSDIVLVISEFEVDWLINNTPLEPEQIMYLPFVYESSNLKNQIPFEERKHGVFIGNLKHAPNVDAVEQLYHSWHPILRKCMPDFETHIYGPYAPTSVLQLHQPKKGFFVHAAAEEVLSTLEQYKVLLAPLRFGAGIKGKLLEAMRASTPSVTTTVGIEGIASKEDWGGAVIENEQELTAAFLTLYQNEERWNQSVQKGYRLIQKKFDKAPHQTRWFKKLYQTLEQLSRHRRAHFITQVFWHQSLRSTEYMSRWITLKNTVNPKKT